MSSDRAVQAISLSLFCVSMSCFLFRAIRFDGVALLKTMAFIGEIYLFSGDGAEMQARVAERKERGNTIYGASCVKNIVPLRI